MNPPNKVFYIGRELNFMATPFTMDQMKDNILKSMVSGWGPFPIVSIKVVNKVATVNLGEKPKQYPGGKVSFEGTNVAGIDTWHEIKTVTAENFTFEVDVPDGEYASGVTMSYPPLGWRLLDRDANRLLLQSGTSGSTPHQVLLTFNRGRPPVGPGWAESENWRNTMCIEKVESDGTVESVRNPIPNNYQIGMKIPIEMIAPLNYDHSWFMYGDDAFVVFGHAGWWKDGERYTKRANLSHVLFGEVSRSQYRNGAFFINGEPNIDTLWSNFIGQNGFPITWSMWAGCLAGAVTGQHQSVVIATNVNERSNYGDNASVFPSGFQPAVESRSGFNFDTGISKYINNNGYNSPLVINRRYEMIGELPGVIYFSQMPHMAPSYTYTQGNGDVVESFLKPIKPLGRLKDRKCYAFYSGGYNSWQSGANNQANIYWPWQSSAGFDLTGPIR